MNEITCIVCPRGCRITLCENGEVIGNNCKRGEEYGRKEIASPERMVSSTVRIENAIYKVCPVKTSSSIPKGIVEKAVASLSDVTIFSPVSIGDRIKAIE